MSQSSPNDRSGGPFQGPLPAGEVLNEAFQFAARRWGTVLRYAWLPMAIGLFVVYAYSALAFEMEPGLDGANGTLSLRMPAALAFALGAGVFGACAFLYAGFMTSLFRLVATGEERGGFVHGRMDEPVSRVFWAVLIVNGLGFALMAMSLLIALVATGSPPGETFEAVSEFFSLAAAASASGEAVPVEAAERLAEPVGLVFLSVVGALLPIIYLNIRLTPFAAGSAVENRLVLFGAFRLTGGRFWPIFLIQSLIVICLFALSIIVELGAEILEQLGTLLAGIGGVGAIGGAVVLAAGFLIAAGFQLFSAAVQLSAQGIIYRRLKTGE